MTIQAMDPPINQPKTKEMLMLMAIVTIMTVVRPSRSDRYPAIPVEKTPINRINEQRLAPVRIAWSFVNPATTKQATKNAGVHARIPSSSQTCAVYPAIIRRAGRWVSNSFLNFIPSLRDLFSAILLRIKAGTTAPRIGPDVVAKKANRHP